MVCQRLVRVLFTTEGKCVQARAPSSRCSRVGVCAVAKHSNAEAVLCTAACNIGCVSVVASQCVKHDAIFRAQGSYLTFIDIVLQHSWTKIGCN